MSFELHTSSVVDTLKPIAVNEAFERAGAKGVSALLDLGDAVLETLATARASLGAQ